MTSDILAHEQLKIELINVLSKFFMRHLEEILQEKIGNFQSIDKITGLVFGKRLGRRGELQLMTVNVESTKNQSYEVVLAFKFLNNPESAAKEGNGAVWLTDILKNNFKIHTPRLLYFSHQNSLLIYQGLVDTHEYLDSKLDQPQKLFLSGLALPYIHGISRNKVMVDRYLHLITGVTDGLNIPPGDKNELFSLFKDDLNRVGTSEAGANCFGDFHPGNIMFKESERPSSNIGDTKIDRTEVFLIDPAYVDSEGNVDRAEDIGTFFSKFAYNDYYLSESFDRTIADLEILCRGYDYAINQNQLSLIDFYPEGSTFDFQIALGIMIDTMFKTKTFGASNIQDRVNKCIEAVQYILRKRPFDIYE